MTATRSHYGVAYYGVDYYGIRVSDGIGYAIEMELDGVSGGWTDVTEDVIFPLKDTGGMMGNTISDRVASTGVMTFDMDNSATNSGSTLGWYSPGGGSVRSGFAPGIPVRLTMTDNTNTKRVYGRIARDGIQADAMQYGPRRTHVTVVDYINYAAEFPIELQAVATDQRADQAISTIVGLFAVAPLSTSYATGQDTFSYVFDTLNSRTRALSEFQKLALSEFGYIYVKRDATYGEVLTFDARHTRTALSSAGTINDAMIGMQSLYGGNYANRVKVTCYPRQIDAAATTVLASLQKVFEIASGDEETLLQQYRDPTGGSKQVSGIEMVTPVAAPDYTFNTAADGSGSDITADLSVTANYGGEGVQWVLTNNNGSSGFVTKLQARGKGIYFYDPAASISEVSAGIASYGEIEVAVNQSYQDSPLNSTAAAEYYATRLSTFRDDVSNVTFVPNKSAALTALFLSLDIGDLFTLTETLTGVSSDYFINAVDFELSATGVITCNWTPYLSTGEKGWILGTSALDTAAILLF